MPAPELRPHNEAGEAKAAHRGLEQRLARGTDDALAIGPGELETGDVPPEGARAVMVLAVNVVGDGAADRYPAGTGHDREKPAARHDEIEDLRQGDPRLASEQAAGLVQCDEPIQPPNVQQYAPIVEATVAVAPPACVGEDWSGQTVQGRQVGAPGHGHHRGGARTGVASP
jgi:hypothetical protein